MAKLYEIDDLSETPEYSKLTSGDRVALGKRRGKQLKKRGLLYKGVDFSGEPTETPVDMFGKPQKHGTMARRRKKLSSALRERRTFLDAPGEILTDV
ncbi:MAG: hypothetical protein GOVbin2277_19 [Prokaryotic dsDNA virus sp.]|jgi:hypothetical protein|nr:MAG: hypothetical protein GOVbin2277_19 [Prokaryotic dsDNA virus sp.]|tara:strand:+ start:459 stop:749 length:291 start_codon:yes stop_codon:yes gene_type:complete